MRSSAPADTGASQEAIEFHYDMPAAFFALWLGRTMTYTAARFSDPGMSLDAAQEDKIAWHLDAARVAEGRGVLDIGCGWGSLLARAVEARGATRAHGLTLSRLQRDYISGLGVPGVTASLESYERFRPEARCDAIVSVGAFEHFVKPGASAEERRAAYDGFFRRCAEWLAPGGRLSLQTMAWGDCDPADRRRIRIHEIFPESDLPEIAEVVEAAHPHLELERMENRPEDYERTLAAWAQGLKANAQAATAIVGPERYDFYLRSCTGGSLLYRRRRFYLCRFAFRLRGRA